MLMLSNKTYDFLKRLVQVVLPALASLYFGLASIWGLPAAEQVVGTIAVLTTFLGVTLGISLNTYKASGAEIDGSLVISEPIPGKKLFSVEVDEDPNELAKKDKLSLQIVLQDSLEAEDD